MNIEEVRDYALSMDDQVTEMLDAAINQFDNVWIGSFFKNCDRRAYCADPIK